MVTMRKRGPIQEHPRRSSRLENVAPVSYVENGKDLEEEDEKDLRREGGQPEVYTEEQENESPVEDALADNANKRSKTTGERVSEYELIRQQRIKENMERMQKLGILTLKSDLLPPKQPPRKTPLCSSKLPSLEPTRRSSRLQNVTPSSDVKVEDLTSEPEESSEEEDVKDEIREEVKPEIYTEEYEKLLGSSETPWKIKKRKKTRIPLCYSDIAKRCHQCRVRTLDKLTHCSKCNMVQGQICGNCLCMRYGENLLEAKMNSSWICPVCRGICNCHLCRKAKGWLPTGNIYKTIAKLGFKSVAHYLIQTRRSQTNSEQDQSSNGPVSTKRSLPFADTEESSEQRKTLNPDENEKHIPEDSKDAEVLSQLKETLNSNENSKPLSEDIKDDNQLMEVKEEAGVLVIDLEVPNATPAPKSKLKKNPLLCPEYIPNSVAGRLRQRRVNS